MSHEEMHCLRSYFLCTFPDSGCVCTIWLLNQVAQQISANKKIFYWPNWVDFPEVESKGYDSKTLAKKTKAWEEILTKFNSQNLNGIKSDLSQLQGCWRRLKLQSKKEHVVKQEKRVAEKLLGPQVK